MARTGWMKLGWLARDLACALFVYALLLQALAPLAVARGGLDGGAGVHRAALCSVMMEAGDTGSNTAPERLFRDCLSCCVACATGVLPMPGGVVEMARFALLLAPATSAAPVLPSPAGSPPPPRAPPVSV